MNFINNRSEVLFTKRGSSVCLNPKLLLVVFLASVLVGCGGDEIDDDHIQFTEAGSSGNLHMALTVNSGDNQYRLTEGTIYLEGPQSLAIDVSKNFVEQPNLDLTLVVGTYTVKLGDDWVLASQQAGEWVAHDDAVLLSDVVQTAEIVEDGTTSVSLNFQVLEEDINFTTGQAAIDVSVAEVACEDGHEKMRSCTYNGILGTSSTLCVDGQWNGWTECEIDPELVGGNMISIEPDVEIVVTCLGKDASYVSNLYLDNNNTFICDSGDVGKEVSLGFWPADEELIFRLDVLTSGKTYYTGAAERNPDNIEHAKIEMQEDGSLHFGFEDLYGGGDQDYNDCNFQVVGLEMALIN